MDFLIRVLKAHIKKNAEAARIIEAYKNGLITCRDCLLSLADTMQN